MSTMQVLGRVGSRGVGNSSRSSGRSRRGTVWPLCLRPSPLCTGWQGGGLRLTDMAGVFPASSPPPEVSFLLTRRGTAVIGLPGDADASHSQGLDHTRQRSTSCTWAKHRTRGLRPLPGAVQREAQASLAGGDGGGGGPCHHLLEGDGQGLTSQWTVGSPPPQVASAWSMY